MSIFARFADARRRRRTVFDSGTRSIIRRIERKIKFFLSSPLGAVIRPRKVDGAIDISKVKNVLILRYDALGDAVLSSAVWHAVKTYGPHIRIGVVASRRNIALIRSDPSVSDVFLFSKALAWHIILDLLRARRAAKWDVVLNISFHDKTRAALYSRFVAPHAVTATAVLGHREKYERIYSIVGQREAVPIVRQWLHVFEIAFGIQIPEEESYPKIFADSEIERTFGHDITEMLAGQHKSNYIIVNTDAAQAFREWGFDNALAMSLRIQQQWPDLHILWTSLPQHAELVQAFLVTHSNHGIEYLLTPSVHHLLVAVKNASAVISPDTSVVHIAAAYKRPTVGLYVEHNEFPIRGTVSRMVFADVGKAATAIPVDSVFTAFQEIMSEAKAAA